MKECIADDGETYYEIQGNWYRKVGDKIERASKPKILISCKILDKNAEKDFFIKHLVKEKREK